MTSRIVLWSEADRMIAEHYAHIHEDEPEAAERFLETFRNHLETLAAFPRMGRSLNLNAPALHGVRISGLPKRFRNYLVFYRELEESIEVFTIEHASRDIHPRLKELLGDSLFRE